MFQRRPSKHASAVVTGAGSGIGRAFALELARRNGRVVCADIRPERAHETVALIEQQGGKALALACDVADLTAVENLAVQSEQWLHEPVTLVINNAGIGAGGKPIGDIPIEDWRKVVDVNMWGVINGCHVFAPLLRAQGHGGIINVCSAASFAAAPLMGPYSLTKAAVLSLTETLHAEMVGTSVHVTALCPTFVKTNIVRDAPVDDDVTRLAQRLMDWTGIEPERVAKTTLNALDRNQLYVLPQLDARLAWRAKRLAPASYTAGSGLLARLSTRLSSTAGD